MGYDFVPIAHRKPLIWPNGARLALIVTLNLECRDNLKDSEEIAARYLDNHQSRIPAVRPEAAQ